MASKYQLDHIRERIVSHIESDWPSTLKEWDDADHLLNMEEHESYMKLHGLRSRLPEPAAAIVLARRFGITKILPAAFYELSRRDVCNNKTYVYNSELNDARGDILNVEELQILVDYNDYIRYTAKILFEEGDYTDCIRDNCSSQLSALAKLLQLTVFRERDFLRSTRQINWAEHDLCRICTTTAREEVEEKRKEVWADFMWVLSVASACNH